MLLRYRCRNCEVSRKAYALYYDDQDEESKTYSIIKYGEYPFFGPPIPSKAISLIGPDREQFLQGRRCENQSLGVGAFVYYRRVVENQKNRIIDKIIRVSNHLNVDKQLISELEAAKREVQFTKGVDQIKQALPESLNIDGKNPLLLLHKALSKGVHELNDEECLKYAQSVRTVLIIFAERLSQAMKDDAELKQAVNHLANGK